MHNAQWSSLYRRPTFFPDSVYQDSFHPVLSPRGKMLANMTDQLDDVHSPKMAMDFLRDEPRQNAWREAMQKTITAGS